MSSIGIKFPIGETQNGGIIMDTKTTADAIKSNLIAFLFLKKRQRVMRSKLYSPLYDYIMEAWDETMKANLKLDLQNKLAENMPEISVNDIFFDFKEETNLLNIKIVYTIVSLNMQDQVAVNIPIQS